MHELLLARALQQVCMSTVFTMQTSGRSPAEAGYYCQRIALQELPPGLSVKHREKDPPTI